MDRKVHHQYRSVYSVLFFLICLPMFLIYGNIVIVSVHYVKTAPVLSDTDKWNLTVLQSRMNITRNRQTANEVMLLGYFRGGTTFLGEVLGKREGSFYLYEPLYQLARFEFFTGNSLCSMVDSRCRPSNMANTVEELLNAVYDCDFTKVRDKLRMWQFSKGQGLEDWKKMTGCNNTEDECLQRQIQRCKIAKFRVTKEFRVTIGFLENLLRKRDHLKIVFLLRDPRAIIHSRRNIWTSTFGKTEVVSTALCAKMKDDFTKSKILEKKFPNRIYTLFYESYVENPNEITKDMYNFLGYDFKKDDSINIQNMTNSTFSGNAKNRFWTTISRNSMETARAWRASILYHVMHFVNKNCFDVFTLMNYPKLSSAKELHNPEMPLIYPSSNNTGS